MVNELPTSHAGDIADHQAARCQDKGKYLPVVRNIDVDKFCIRFSNTLLTTSQATRKPDTSFAG
jgi:hypothetical protein